MKVVRIGGAAAFLMDSLLALPQLLDTDEPLDYLVFDLLAEGTVANIGRAMIQTQGSGFADEFIEQIRPHLPRIERLGIRVIANAGALNPVACAEAVRTQCRELGLDLQVASIGGDNLTDRLAEIVTDATFDMFDGLPVAEQVRSADRIVSIAAYTGAFPIAAALDAGADIVITGRSVDSAAALGALVHEFGWGPDDFDRLAAGTLAGHLVECTTQVTGGIFTDWQAVPGWEDVGFPIVECRKDGSMSVTKPKGTGGIVTTATVAEQLLYEVGDPAGYVVPDVICDFTRLVIQQEAHDAVSISGARGRGRPGDYKISLCYDRGWRASALIPILGLESGAKAKRAGLAIIERTRRLLRQAQLPDWSGTSVDVFGGSGAGFDRALARIVVDHPSQAGVNLFGREFGAALISMAVGSPMPLGFTIRPIQFITSFLLPKSQLELTISLNGKIVSHRPANRALEALPPERAPFPELPVGDTALAKVPLHRLAWGRSGDKGNLFNVAIIARQPHYLPYIVEALRPDAVGRFFAGHLDMAVAPNVERFHVPCVNAVNFLVHDSMEGGMMASRRIDPGAKSYAQALLGMEIAIPQHLCEELDVGGK